jgi:hypothetical protein
VGTIVHLRPNTKTAGRACRAYRAAKVLSYERLPLVLVEVQYRADEQHNDGDEIAVHIQDIGLHPAAKPTKNEGDMAQGSADIKAPRPLHTPHKPLDLPPGWAEEPLF